MSANAMLLMLDMRLRDNLIKLGAIIPNFAKNLAESQ